MVDTDMLVQNDNFSVEDDSLVVEEEAAIEGEETEEQEEEQQEEAATEGEEEEAAEVLAEPDKDALWQNEINTLKQKLDEVSRQQQAQVKPPYVEIDYGKVEAWLNETLEQVENLKLEGRVLESIKLQKSVNALIDQIDQNESNKAKWEQEQLAEQRKREQAELLNAELQNTAALLKQHYNVPDDIWTAGEKFFAQARAKDPVLNAKYQEKIMKLGAVEAMDWAFKYVQENIPKAPVPKKPTAPTPGQSSQENTVNLNKLLEKARKSGSNEDFIAYRHAKKRSQSLST